MGRAEIAAFQLSQRFMDALEYASTAHVDQARKGGSIPYISHPLGVASLVMEAGGNENLAMAGLLHDVLEDTDVTLDDLEARFGESIAGIVAASSDTEVHPKPAWRDRKEAYIAHLRLPETSEDVLTVSLADELYNARAILLDLRTHGSEFWKRFNVGPREHLWYYGSLVDVFCQRLPGPHADELRRVVAQLSAEVG